MTEQETYERAKKRVEAKMFLYPSGGLRGCEPVAHHDQPYPVASISLVHLASLGVGHWHPLSWPLCLCFFR